MKKFKITIPNPCHENWDAMSLNAKGRFCGSCNKTVVDFTKMNKGQIAEYLKNHSNVCGNFTLSQLETKYHTHSPLYFPLRRIALIAGLSFVSLQFTNAQTHEAPTEQVDTEDKQTANEPAKDSVKTQLQGRLGIVSTVPCDVRTKGKVAFEKLYGIIDIKGTIFQDMDNGIPLANAKVSVLGHDNEVFTNKNGMFSLSAEKLSKKFVRLLIEKDGFKSETKIYKVKKNQKIFTIKEELFPMEDQNLKDNE